MVSMIDRLYLASDLQLDKIHHLSCYMILPRVLVRVFGPQWPIRVFVSQNSSVQMNCTLTDSPFWSIDLAEDASTVPLQFVTRGELLNAHGVYELPQIETPGMPPTLRLLINDTARNNQTEIICAGLRESIETTLFVDGMLHHINVLAVLV